MVTGLQGDPRGALLAHLVGQVQLSDGARMVIQGFLQDVSIGSLQTPADIANAMSSMDRLSAYLTTRKSLGGQVNAATLQMAFRDLCPLFPIC